MVARAAATTETDSDGEGGRDLEFCHVPLHAVVIPRLAAVLHVVVRAVVHAAVR